MNNKDYVYETIRCFHFAADDLLIHANPSEDVKLFAICSDWFVWGTADAEEITPENLPVLQRTVSDLRDAGVMGDEGHLGTLFAARIRGMRPQGAAYAYIPEVLVPLYDACGPEREAELGNPQTREQGMERQR